MATLTVLKFDDAHGAEQALETLQRLQRRHLLVVQDAAVVSWPTGSKGPKTRQAIDTTRAGALSGGFWGFLLGLLFFAPLAGLAVGAATGALGGALTDVGIDDDFIAQTRSKITPGTSALFLLSEEPVEDRVVAELQGLHPELVTTNLPVVQESRLREIFAGHQVPA
jgi:uncharacterized membrane protein